MEYENGFIPAGITTVVMNVAVVLVLVVISLDYTTIKYVYMCVFKKEIIF